MKTIFKDAIGQSFKINGTALFLDLNIPLEEECFYEIGETGEDENSKPFYGTGKPINTDEYLSIKEVKEYVSNFIYLEDFLEKRDDFLRYEADITLFVVRLTIWLDYIDKENARKLLKANSEGYKWIIQNIRK